MRPSPGSGGGGKKPKKKKATGLLAEGGKNKKLPPGFSGDAFARKPAKGSSAEAMRRTRAAQGNPKARTQPGVPDSANSGFPLRLIGPGTKPSPNRPVTKKPIRMPAAKDHWSSLASIWGRTF